MSFLLIFFLNSTLGGLGEYQKFDRIGEVSFFTALHSVVCTGRSFFIVKLSVCPSFKRVNFHKTKEISAQILIPYERPMHLVLRQEEWLVVDWTTSSKWNFGPNWPTYPFKNADFQSIVTRSASARSAVTPSEQSSIINNRKSTYGFPTSLKWTVYVALSPLLKGSFKTQWPFFVLNWIFFQESLLQSNFVRKLSAAKL